MSAFIWSKMAVLVTLHATNTYTPLEVKHHFDIKGLAVTGSVWLLVRVFPLALVGKVDNIKLNSSHTPGSVTTDSGWTVDGSDKESFIGKLLIQTTIRLNTMKKWMKVEMLYLMAGLCSWIVMRQNIQQKK